MLPNRSTDAAKCEAGSRLVPVRSSAVPVAAAVHRWT